jgi:selenocysteine-specific elongation factor
MPVIGTAGHVDHGKSTLVLALTGRDPDRWAEEKARGLTIDLGFAWTTLPGGTEVSFVDVPGHEHFIKNMLAGIEAVDVALLVVAADEGWMPQSEEHLAVLDLLDVTLGVVALTKVDRVDRELVELATLEIEERLAGTSLTAATVIPVSASGAIGIDALRSELARLVAMVPTPGEGRPRLWVDRSFSIAGAGTVVTGTLLDGSLSVGDRVLIWPGPIEARIRGLQSHERDHTTVGPNRRVAVNLVGLERDMVERGAMLGTAGQWIPTSRVAVGLRRARYVEEIPDRGAYQLHIGSGAWPARVRLVGEHAAVVDLPHPLPLRMGDRFVLRETGRRLVMAGGRVLDPAPPRRSVDLTGLAGSLDHGADGRAAALLALRGRERADVLAAHTGGGSVPGAVVAGSSLVDPAAAAAFRTGVVEMVERYHRKNALRAGAPVATVASALGVEAVELEALVAAEPLLVIEGSNLRLASFSVDRSPAHDAAWAEAKRRLAEAGPAVPRLMELGLDRELIHALVREGALVKISAELAYLPEQVEALVTEMRAMGDDFTVTAFKDRVGLSRKYAVPLLEWADATGLTVRTGDTRRLRSP